MNIIDRIQKLFALSQRNSSTDEAAAAGAKIQELCFKHNLELEAILSQGATVKEPYVKYDYLMPQTTRADVGWKRTLFAGVCRANFCKAVYIPNTVRMAVIGQKHNFEVVVYEYEYLVKEIQRLAVEGCQKQGYLRGKDKGRYIRGFCEGAMSQVYYRLDTSYKQQAAATTESRALVVVKDKELDQAVRVYFPRLTTTSRRAGGSADGYSDGHKAGASITVNRGVQSTTRKMID
jgi:hypothetical protein